MWFIDLLFEVIDNLGFILLDLDKVEFVDLLWLLFVNMGGGVRYFLVIFGSVILVLGM